ncbi:MAG: hypothetical protein FWC47_17275 [Oscillospiraceae bacterium]|nr:hypothetical protein [Oscillospiraceae bacterium]
MSSDLTDDGLKEIDDNNLNEIDAIELIGKSDNLHIDSDTTINKIKKNKFRNSKFKKLPIKTLIKTKTDIDETDNILKDLENINLQLNQMDENLDNTLKWVSNVCIITILGMVVIIITIAAAVVFVINNLL